jgi:hypothetical protein
MKLMFGFDIRFGNMALVLFDREHEMHLHDVVDDAMHSFNAIGCKLSKRLGDLDMPASDIYFHEQPP